MDRLGGFLRPLASVRAPPAPSGPAGRAPPLQIDRIRLPGEGFGEGEVSHTPMIPKGSADFPSSPARGMVLPPPVGQVPCPDRAGTKSQIGYTRCYGKTSCNLAEWSRGFRCQKRIRDMPIRDTVNGPPRPPTLEGQAQAEDAWRSVGKGGKRGRGTQHPGDRSSSAQQSTIQGGEGAILSPMPQLDVLAQAKGVKEQALPRTGNVACRPARRGEFTLPTPSMSSRKRAR